MSQLLYPSASQPISRRRLIVLWYQYHGPTWAMLLGVYSMWLGLTVMGGDWPWWLVLGLGPLALCSYSSLQHELIHGHLGVSRCWRERLVGLPLSVWLPYALYRDSHLAHHECPELTDPLDDPESYYVSDTAWEAMGLWRRGLLWCNQTLLGRLLIGPWLVWVRVYQGAWQDIYRGESTAWRLWGEHLLGVGLVLLWLVVWEFSLLDYFLLVVWPGTSLMLIRSFHEHRPAASQAQASVIVEAGVLWRWLFLNNNYHVLHHHHPEWPWFRLHQRYCRARRHWQTVNGGYYYSGYRHWFWRFGLSPRDTPRYAPGTIAASEAATITPEDASGHATLTPHRDHRCPESGSGSGSHHLRSDSPG